MTTLHGIAAISAVLTASAISQDAPAQPERMKTPAVEDRAKITERAPWRIGLMATPVAPVIRAHLNLPEGAGLMVDRVVEGSPAALAGIVENDIIVAAGDRKIDSLETLKTIVEKAGKENEPLTLSVLQKGKLNQVKITRTRPAESPQARGERPAENPLREMMRQQDRRFEEMTRAMREMRQRLEQQQQQIDALKKKLAERDAGPRPQRHDNARPVEPQRGVEKFD